MSKITSMMDVGKRSMMNSQTALQTVSHNIANKSTEGYSRQRVETETNVPVGEGKLRIGTGARAAEVTRTNNPFLEKQIQMETGKLGYSEKRSEHLGRVEQIFNEQLNKGLNHFVSDFFNAFQELSNNPESQATRTLVRENANFVAKDFGRVTKSLRDIQDEVDFSIASELNEVNAITEEIADLNTRVMSVEISGAGANDERDRRDLLVKRLGEKLNIHVAEGKSGEVTITAGQTAVLVSGSESATLSAEATPEHDNKREGNVDIVYRQTKYTDPMIVTDQIKSGKIGGALTVRDETINGLIQNMDEMAYNLARAVNDAHIQGYNAKGETNIDFFKEPDQVRGAASNLQLSEEIARDANNIAAAATPDAPGDNRVANVIANLQTEKIMGEDAATLDDYYGGVIGRLAVITKKANGVSEHQKGIVTQLENIRESISGVSLDEEAMKMIEYQKSYEASAKLIKVADDMLRTVIELVR